MTGMFKKSAKMVRSSGMVILMWLVSFGIACIGATYFCEDYQTSVEGYALVPTQHSYPWIIWIGALTPQLGQVFFAYLAADDDKRWWAWAATGALFLVDAGTDILFKTLPGVQWSLAATILEVLIMYTLCSEVFLAMGVGLCLELLPDMKRACVALKTRWKEASVHRSEAWGLHARGDSPRGMSRPSDGRHRPSSGVRRSPVGEPQSGNMPRGEVRW